MSEELRAFLERLRDALKSGKYTFGRNYLRQKGQWGGGECHCVMGVAADLIDPDGWKEDPHSGLGYLWRGSGYGLREEEFGMPRWLIDALMMRNDNSNSYERAIHYIECRLEASRIW